MSEGSKGLSRLDKADEINLYKSGSMDKGRQFLSSSRGLFHLVEKLLCLFLDLETIFENIFGLPS